MFFGFGSGISGNDTTREVTMTRYVVVYGLLLGGFVLQWIALAVGLAGRRRLGLDEHDQRLSAGVWISCLVIALVALIAALAVAGTLFAP